MTRLEAPRRARARAERAHEPSVTPATAPSRFWTPALVGLVVIGALLRLYYLGQPMRYDESVTYLRFAARSWSTVVSSYTYPNNHVFHTLLVKACVTLLGDDPWVIRLPAFVAGVAMIPLTFSLGGRRFGLAAAYIGTALVSSSGALALYSTNARGYTMICLATLILAALLLRLRGRPSTALWTASVVVTALGTWTVPVMLLPAGGLALWFALSALHGDTSERRGDLRRLGLAVVAAAILTLLLYSPIIAREGWAALVANAFVSGSPWRVFFEQLSSSVEPVLTGWTLGLPLAISTVLGVCAIIGVVDARQATDMRVSMAGSMYVWCAAVLLVIHRAPFPRVWLFLIPPLALLAAHGTLQLQRGGALQKGLVARAGEVSIAMAMILGSVVILSRDVVMSRDTGTLYHAEQIATALSGRLRPGDRVIAPVPSNAPLAYYFVRAGIDTTYLSSRPRDSSRVYLIVNTSEGFTIATPLGDPLIRRFRSARPIARYPTAEIYRLQ